MAKKKTTAKITPRKGSVYARKRNAEKIAAATARKNANGARSAAVVAALAATLAFLLLLIAYAVK